MVSRLGGDVLFRCWGAMALFLGHEVAFSLETLGGGVVFRTSHFVGISMVGGERKHIISDLQCMYFVVGGVHGVT